jgi:hypothetical protein
MPRSRHVLVVRTTLATVLASAAMAVSAGQAAAAEAPRSVRADAPAPGGWTASDDQTAIRISGLVLNHLNAEPGSTGDHTMGDILCASQQVVAGMNFHVRFTIDLDTQPKLVDAVVWEQAWLNSDQVTSLTVTPL